MWGQKSTHPGERAGRAALDGQVGHGFEEAVDLFFGRVVEEAGAYGASGVVEAEGSHRLEGVVVAVPDVQVLFAEELGHLARGAAGHVEAERRRPALRRADPVQLHAVGEAA